jgi:hypothetical protein
VAAKSVAVGCISAKGCASVLGAVVHGGAWPAAA